MTANNPIPFNPATMTASELMAAAETLKMIFEPLVQEAHGNLDIDQADQRLCDAARHAFRAAQREAASK